MEALTALYCEAAKLLWRSQGSGFNFSMTDLKGMSPSNFRWWWSLREEFQQIENKQIERSYASKSSSGKGPVV